MKEPNTAPRTGPAAESLARMWAYMAANPTLDLTAEIAANKARDAKEAEEAKARGAKRPMIVWPTSD